MNHWVGQAQRNINKHPDHNPNQLDPKVIFGPIKPEREKALMN